MDPVSILVAAVAVILPISFMSYFYYTVRKENELIYKEAKIKLEKNSRANSNRIIQQLNENDGATTTKKKNK